MPRLSLRAGAAMLAVAVLALAAGAFAVFREHETPCPTGYAAPESDADHGADAAAADPDKAGCVALKHPERFDDLMKVNTQLSRRYTIAGQAPRTGAHAAAVRTAQTRAAQPRTVAGSGGTWNPAGQGPLIADDPRYGSVN